MADQEPTPEEIRERADKARAKRAAERAARKSEETKTDEAKDEKKGKRRWWNWLIDIVLVGASAYLIWARFIRKEAPPDAPPPKPATSMSVAGPQTSVLKAGTELRAGAGPMFASVETIAAPTTFETVEAPAAGWVKVKTPSGKVGWVPVDAIGTGLVAPSISASVSASAPAASVSAP